MIGLVAKRTIGAWNLVWMHEEFMAMTCHVFGLVSQLLGYTMSEH